MPSEAGGRSLQAGCVWLSSCWISPILRAGKYVYWGSCCCCLLQWSVEEYSRRTYDSHCLRAHCVAFKLVGQVGRQIQAQSLRCTVYSHAWLQSVCLHFSVYAAETRDTLVCVFLSCSYVCCTDLFVLLLLELREGSTVLRCTHRENLWQSMRAVYLFLHQILFMTSFFLISQPRNLFSFTYFLLSQILF